MQLLLLISAIANGGKFYLPQVVERMEDVYGKTLSEYPPVEAGQADVSERTLRYIQEALMGAVNDPRGTGWACVLKDAKVAGKTGTAQVIKMAEDFRKGDMDRMPLKFRDHAWFVAYAPFEDPVISVVVLVEHGGYGGAAAAPIAKKVIEKYLGLESTSPVKVAGQLE
jgi:penicillin-binding protein 2